MAKQKKGLEKAIEELGAFQNEPTEDKKENKMSDDNLGFEPTNDEAGEFFNPDFSDTHEEVALADGSEALLRLQGVYAGTDKNGNPFKRLVYEPVEEPYAKPLSFFLFMPTANDSARVRNRKNLTLQRWMQAHKLEGGFNWAEIIGTEVWAILRLTQNEKYGEQNEVKEWVRSA